MTSNSTASNRRCLTALPIYNEARHIPDVLDEVRRYSSDILVVNDGSTDDTRKSSRRSAGKSRSSRMSRISVTARRCERHFDYAAEHGYDVIVTIDCDGQHQPRLIPELAAAVFPPGEEPVDIVSGSRYLKTIDGNSVPPEERRRINVLVTELVNERLGLELTDAFCGFKAYRVAALKKIKITELGYAMPLQFWAQAAALGLRIVEFPVPLVYLEEKRSFGGSLDDGQRRLAYYQDRPGPRDRGGGVVSARPEHSAMRGPESTISPPQSDSSTISQSRHTREMAARSNGPKFARQSKPPWTGHRLRAPRRDFGTAFRAAAAGGDRDGPSKITPL